MIIIDPLIFSAGLTGIVVCCWCSVAEPLVHGKPIVGPTTTVIIIAPPTVTSVPTIFPMLRIFLIFTFSNLPKITSKNLIYLLKILREHVEVETIPAYPSHEKRHGRDYIGH